MKRVIRVMSIVFIISIMLISTVFGAQVKKTIEVVFNSVNITVNGNKIAADNILYNGTTYVPLRAVAEALGKDVGWDQATYTASINDKGYIAPTPAPVQPTQKETLSQQQAVKKAQSYLNIMAFSRSGLIEQLEYEGFSQSDATYAVDKLNVDWKQQALKKAKSYLSIMAFSRSGLIEQLEYEGYSRSDATYAVDQIGLY